MAQEKRTFIGGMDFDTESRYLKQGDYRAAINMKPSGENDGMGTLENIVGSEFIDDTNTVGWSGTAITFTTDRVLGANSKVIGVCRDEVYDRIIYFIRESDTECSIYEYSQKQNAISVIVNKFDLDFHEDYLITGANVIAHGEPWAPDGLLYFTDNLNPPRKINIAKAKLMTTVVSANIQSEKYYSAYHNNGVDTELVIGDRYTSLTQQIFDAVKYPPVYSPEVLLGTDNSYIKNSIANNQWQLKYRYVYDDKEKSSWSPISKNIFSVSSTPVGAVPLETDNYIEVSFNSGTKEVEIIEIAARSLTAGGDFFLIDSIRKNTTNPVDNVYAVSANDGSGTEVVLSSNNTDYFFRFFNNLVYNSINLKESVKLFDDVPLKSKSQELIDGNRIAYGNVVNGRTGVESKTSLELFYQDATIPTTSTDITYAVSASPLTQPVSSGSFQERFGVDYTLKINLDSIITAGSSPANTSYSFNADNLGVLFMHAKEGGAFGEDKRSQLIGALNGSLVLGVLPAMPEDTFYQYMFDAFSEAFPTLESMLDIAWEFEYDEPQGPIRLPGHELSTIDGMGPENVDSILWELDSENGELLFRFNIRTRNAVDITYNNQAFGVAIGHDIGADQANQYSSYSTLTVTSQLDLHTYAPDLSRQLLVSKNSYWQNYEAGTPVYFFKGISLNSIQEPENGFKSNAHHEIGIVYYDKANRSSAVCESPKQIYIPFYGERDSSVADSPAAIKLTIEHSPPSWASTYQIVYSGNTSISDFWQFNIKNVEIIDANIFVNINTLISYYEGTGVESAEIYDFVKGDRIKFLKQGEDNDFLIVGTQINDDGELTLKLTANAINELSVVGVGPDFENELIEIYRPLKGVDDDFRIFYEISEVHPVNGGFHEVSDPENVSLLNNTGGAVSVQEQNQTGVQDAVIVLTRGDVYHSAKVFEGNSTYDLIEDFSASDYFKSNYWDAGRPNKVNPDYKELRRPSTIFYSEPFIPNTNINGLNSIFPDDTYEEFDKTYGSIQKLHSRENQLIIFQEDKVSRAQINRNIITTGSGDQILTAQGAVISQAIPYAGEYGISFNPESFSEYAEVLYFADTRRGAVCRLSQNGITPISEYKMKNYFTDFFTILNRTDLSSSSNPDKIAKLYGCFNPKDKEYMLTLDISDWDNTFRAIASNTNLRREAKESTYFDNFGIRNSYSSNAQTENIVALKKQNFAKKTVVFSEGLNRWTHFTDIYGMCEYINNEVVNIINPLKVNTSSVGGTHDGASLYVLKRPDYNTDSYNPENYNEFYSQESGGTQTNGKNIVNADVVFASNVEPSINKDYSAVGIEANLKPTDFEIQNNYRQYSRIFNSYWKTKENYHYSAIYGDVNSFLAYDAGNKYAGIINGEKIRSASATMRCSWTDNNYLRLFAINIGVSPSSKSGVI